jgi:hypothetical protein
MAAKSALLAVAIFVWGTTNASLLFAPALTLEQSKLTEHFKEVGDDEDAENQRMFAEAISDDDGSSIREDKAVLVKDDNRTYDERMFDEASSDDDREAEEEEEDDFQVDDPDIDDDEWSVNTESKDTMDNEEEVSNSKEPDEESDSQLSEQGTPGRQMLLQISAKEEMWKPIMTAANVSLGPTADMEAAVTQMLMSKSGTDATPMGGSIKKIQNLITKTMMPAVKDAHKVDEGASRLLFGKGDIVESDHEVQEQVLDHKQNS